METSVRTETVMEGRSGFEREVLPHYAALRRYALSLTENPEDADDLTQETFLKVLRFWKYYEPDTNIAGWLYAVMRNTFINQYRQRAKSPLIDIDSVKCDEGGKRLLEHLFASADDILKDLIGDTVTRALDAAKNKFRTVLMLCDLEGMSYEEVAGIMHCPIGTVRSRLHRGRKALKLELGGYAERRGYLTATAVPLLKRDGVK